MWTPEAVAMMALLIHTPRPRLDCGIFSWNSTLPICKIVLVLQNRFRFASILQIQNVAVLFHKRRFAKSNLEKPCVFAHSILILLCRFARNHFAKSPSQILNLQNRPQHKSDFANSFSAWELQDARSGCWKKRARNSSWRRMI